MGIALMRRMREARRTPRPRAGAPAQRILGARSWCACIAALALASCESVVVSTVEISEVAVVPPSITLLTGETAEASAVVTETGGDQITGLSVTWTVDDPAIATVDGQGVIQALAQGTTVVRAASQGVSGTAVVRVLAMTGPGPEPEPSCRISNQVVIGDFDVPAGERCVLTNVRILGSLRMSEGASLTASELTVGGRLEAHRAGELVLDGARLFGELTFERGGSVTIRGSHVERRLQLRSNLGTITVSDTRIDDALELQENRGGPFTLFRNISEKLECKENDPPPTGDDNEVEDRPSGQCAGL